MTDDLDQATPELSTLLSALTEKQRRWAEAYAGDAAGNGTKACRMAGYEGSDGTLAVQAYDNRRNPKILAVLEAFIECDPLVPGRIERLRNFGRIANGRVMKTVIDPETGTATDVEVAAEPKDIIAANKELGLLCGDYVTKLAATDAQGKDMKTASTAELFALAALGKGGE